MGSRLIPWCRRCRERWVGLAWAAARSSPVQWNGLEVALLQALEVRLAEVGAASRRPYGGDLAGPRGAMAARLLGSAQCSRRQRPARQRTWGASWSHRALGSGHAPSVGQAGASWPSQASALERASVEMAVQVPQIPSQHRARSLRKSRRTATQWLSVRHVRALSVKVGPLVGRTRVQRSSTQAAVASNCSPHTSGATAHGPSSSMASWQSKGLA